MKGIFSLTNEWQPHFFIHLKVSLNVLLHFSINFSRDFNFLFNYNRFSLLTKLSKFNFSEWSLKLCNSSHFFHCLKKSWYIFIIFLKTQINFFHFSKNVSKFVLHPKFFFVLFLFCFYLCIISFSYFPWNHEFFNGYFHLPRNQNQF